MIITKKWLTVQVGHSSIDFFFATSRNYAAATESSQQKKLYAIDLFQMPYCERAAVAVALCQRVLNPIWT